jgi:hypothetical protein
METFTGECKCGWTGKVRDNQKSAEVDAEFHVAQVRHAHKHDTVVVAEAK